MTTAASGCITLAEERVRDMLANCTAFRTWTGTTTVADAKLRIYYDAVPLPDYRDDESPLAYNVGLRPFAVVWTAMENGFRLNELIGGSGTVKVRFEQNTPSTSQFDWQEADRLFKNSLGAIIHSGDNSNPGLWELSEQRLYAQITSISLDALYRTSEDEYGTLGDAQAAELSIEWGVRQ